MAPAPITTTSGADPAVISLPPDMGIPAPPDLPLLLHQIPVRIRARPDYRSFPFASSPLRVFAFSPALPGSAFEPQRERSIGFSLLRVEQTRNPHHGVPKEAG